MKSDITSQETIAKCKELLDAWSGSRAYTPTRHLGSDAEFVGATSHSIERFVLTTSYRVRWEEWRKMPKGTSYSSSPSPASAYDLWNDIHKNVTDKNFEHGIADTSKREDCPNDDCHDGQVTCSSCDGKGESSCPKCHTHDGCGGYAHLGMPKGGGYIRCEYCHGSGWRLGNGSGRKEPCRSCNPSGYAKGTLNLERGIHPGWKKCTNCGGTGIATCTHCNGSGHVDCPVCEGQGYIVRELFVVQKCTTNTQRKIWLPKSGLSGEFYAVDKLSWTALYGESVVGGKLHIGLSSDASAKAKEVASNNNLKDVWSEQDDALNEAIVKFKSENHDAAHRIVEQSAAYEQYEGIVEYRYKFDGKEYAAWINLATGGVEEAENGLYASIAEETVQLAQSAEKKGIPQDAIYYYCKADAISLKWGLENGTQKKRISQYRKLGAFFGGSFFVGALGLWIPLILQSGLNEIGVASVCVALGVMTICLVSLNEAIQLVGLALPFGVAYASRVWFGDDAASDLVMREGLILSMLIHGLAVVTLTTDSAQRLPGGRAGLIGGGLLAGAAASLPVAMWAGVTTQSFVSAGAALFVIPILVFLFIVRLPTRLRAGKMQKFVQKNDGKGSKIRSVIEGRKPGLVGLSWFLLTVLVFCGLSIGAYYAGTVLDAQFGGLHMKVLEALRSWGIL